MGQDIDTYSDSRSITTQELLIPLIPAAILVLFLFFIDEGYYSFRWMLDFGNWIVFVIYLLALYPLHLLISQFLFKSQRGARKILLVSLVGIPLTLVLLFGFIFG